MSVVTSTARWLLLLCMMAWTATAHAQRAIWMWEEDSYAMLERPQLASENIRFLKRQGISTLYLYADAHEGRLLLTQQPGLYARLIQQLHSEGMEVHALLGSWPLHTERYVLPEYRAVALAMLQRVLDYNAQAHPSARFDGVNLDIEPHVLDSWSSKREELLTQFVDLGSAFMALKRRANQPIRIGPAIPFWLDGIAIRWGGKTKPASEHLQDVFDHVVLMDYRDRAEGPDGILSHARNEIAYGRQIGKPVWLGIETAPNEIRKVSFYHLREADMERELAITRRALADEPAFGGFVVHHFSSYKRWLGR